MINTESISKPRVLVFHPALAPYRIDLFNALAEHLNLRLVFLNENVPYQDYDQVSLTQQLDAHYKYLTGGFSVLGRGVRLGVSAEIRQFDPEIVVTHEYSPVTFQVSAYCRRSNLPHVVWTADSSEVIDSESPLRRLARRMVLKYVDGLVVYSENTRSEYQRRFQFDGPIGICPNSQAEVRLKKKLQDAVPASSSLAAEYNLSGRKVILYVGRLAKVKRLDRLINAFASTVDNTENSVLVIVGDGPERESLQAQVRRLEISSRVVFAGHCEGRSLYGWFNLGSLFALTSDFEPWGAVVNEALIAGMPVICTAEAGARELIESGTNGAVVDASDPEELKSTLLNWIGKTGPANTNQAISLRNSLMTREFGDAVAGFMSPLTMLLRKEKNAV